MHTVSQIVAHGDHLLGTRVEVRGLFVMNRAFAYFVDSIDERESHCGGLRVEVQGLRKLIAPRVLPRVGGAYQYSDEAHVIGTLLEDEGREFAFKLCEVERLDLNKQGEWHKVIP